MPGWRTGRGLIKMVMGSISDTTKKIRVINMVFQPDIIRGISKRTKRHIRENEAPASGVFGNF